MMIDKLGAGYYETMEGFAVVIRRLDAPEDKPVVGYFRGRHGGVIELSWYKNGKVYPKERDSADLRLVRRKPHEVWLSEGGLKLIEEGKPTTAWHEPFKDSTSILFREVMEDENA